MEKLRSKTLKPPLCALLVLLAVILANPPAWGAQATAELHHSDYTIAAGDVLDISIWKNQDLTKTLTVLPDGKITFPLIGEVMAEGKTVAQLKQELEQKISRFVPNPVLSVIVQQVNSMVIYVLGKVNNPGRFALNKNVNVLQALAIAGGLNPFAERNNIKIFREEGGKTIVFDFKYDPASKGEDLKQNIHLKRGDLIVVR